MKMIRVFVFFVILATIFSSYSASAQELLSVQWPTSFCYWTSCSYKPPKSPRFLIHGLWEDGVKRCRGVAYDGKELSDPGLMKELKKVWPNLKRNEANEVFWKAEWADHGDCVNPQMPLRQYFETTLALYQSGVDFVQNLTAAGLQIGQAYTPKDFRRIMGSVSKKPGVQCVNTKDTYHYLLSELRYCVNPARTALLDCPRSKIGDGCPALGQNAAVSWNVTLTIK